MSRDDGFPTADLDTGFLRDVKVRRLRQHLPAEDMPAAILVYEAVMLSSWAEGYRLSADEADTADCAAATPERVAALQAVGLLDSAGKVPAHVWEAWFRPAWDRRERKRAGGAEGNRRRWHPDKPTVSDSDSDSDSDSVSPSLRLSDRLSPRASDSDATAKKNGAEVDAGALPMPGETLAEYHARTGRATP